MDMITDAFGDVLDQMRTEAAGAESNNVVEILVDCLQNGMEFIMEGDRNKGYFDSLTEEDEPASVIPIHQMKQMELGHQSLPNN
jgi:hypothetical protein